MNIMNIDEPNQKKSETAQTEESILSFWQDNNIFEKTLEKDSPRGDFVFYDGPPFATGLPHYGHLLTGTIKDIIPRYKTMQGYHVPRKWGWDCHGLPVENLIEKELGLATKKDIEEYGLEKFNLAARNSVLRYESEWKHYVPRSGRFVDMDNAYMAMDPEYMESIWWVFGELHNKGLTKEGFKAMHLCPRCETTLANFEVNQGYKGVTDISATVKFELRDEPGTYVLAWTTTPWTLPGNVALAVGANIDYVKIRHMTSFENEEGKLPDSSELSESYIISKEIFIKNSKKLDFNSEFNWYHFTFQGKEIFSYVVSEIKGSDLVGKSYIPPFDYYQNDPEIENRDNGWKIVATNFVTTEDGTGIVHIAPAFGTDDMQLGQELDLPFVQHISKSGAFKHVFAETIEGGDFANMLVKQKGDTMATDIEIIKRLAHDGKLFSKQKIVHSYPHCWRCDTPLLNYATSSWYVDVPAIKDQLIESNKQVHWVPEHVGEGRFGNWLEGAREWALSRSRFWGTPLPVWENQETGEKIILKSYDELCEHGVKSGNTYYTVRHGESQSNLTDSINADRETENPLTDRGREQVQKGAEYLKDTSIIDLIFVSPFGRTQETAKIIASEIGLSDDQIIIDERLREFNPGKNWEGKKWDDFHTKTQEISNVPYTQRVEDDGESLQDVYARVMDLVFEVESKYKNKNILFVSHGATTRMLQFGSTHRGLKRYGTEFFYHAKSTKNAEVLDLNFVPFPHNEKMELDIHRPYIDDFKIEKDGKHFERVSDVFDVWFDSSCMPYAQLHYPFENKDIFEHRFPAQFIAEGLDQTRGWFYVMTVIGNALFGKTPFENVIVNGLVLAEDGKKMSKSLKNYPDPYDMFNTVGADAVRLYMINSPVVRAEEFAFSEKGVRDVASKVMGRLRNTMSLYKMYAGDVDHTSNIIEIKDDKYVVSSENILDKLIIYKTEALLGSVTAYLDKYELDKAVRFIFDFVDDFSTKYIRRSRDRFKGENILDKKLALSTTRYVFETVSKIIAPFTPFVAEDLWQNLREIDPSLVKSVHLEKWPKLHMFREYNSAIDDNMISTDLFDIDLEINMEGVDNIITELLRLRTEVKLNVRKPLASATITLSKDLDKQYIEIIKSELNIKNILFGDTVALDTELTPELIAEGNMRELLRSIQSMRKTAGLDAHDVIKLVIQTSPEGQMLFENFADEIKHTAGISEFKFAHNDGDEIIVNELVFIIAIEK